MFQKETIMTPLDRYVCLLSSEYLNLFFLLTVCERQPLSLATCFRSIKCNLTLGEYIISMVGEFKNEFLEFDFGYTNLDHIVLFVLLLIGKNRCAPLTPPQKMARIRSRSRYFVWLQSLTWSSMSSPLNDDHNLSDLYRCTVTLTLWSALINGRRSFLSPQWGKNIESY